MITFYFTHPYITASLSFKAVNQFYNVHSTSLYNLVLEKGYQRALSLVSVMHYVYGCLADGYWSGRKYMHALGIACTFTTYSGIQMCIAKIHGQ